jgi:hypothetical protein
MTFRHLISELDSLLHNLKDEDGSSSRYEMRLVANRALAHVARNVDVRQICDRLDGFPAPTLLTLRRALDVMRRDFAQCTNIKVAGGGEVIPLRIIDDIESVICAIEVERADVSAPVSTPKSIAINIEEKLQRLLTCYEANGLAPTFLKQCVIQSLAALGDRFTFYVWQMICTEIDAGASDNNWLSATGECIRIQDSESLRLHIADYMTSSRPERVTQLAKRWSSLRMGDTPVHPPGLVVVISWYEETRSPRISLQDQMFGVSLARIEALLTKYYSVRSFDIAAGLGVKSLRYVQLMAPHFCESDSTNVTQQLGRALRDLLTASERRLGIGSSLLRWIQQYKLALETRAPDVSKGLARRDHNYLRRHISGFLLEHGFSAAATSFSTSITDLVVPDDGVDYVIEVKLVRSNAQLRSLRLYLVQLNHYLSQHHPTSQGVLLVYNFLPVSILADQGLIGGRCWIVPVNLHPLPPSRRSRGLLIRAGRGADLIETVKIGASHG